MLRVGVFPASTLSKHKRWDAEYYLGKGDKHWNEKIAKAEAQVQAAQARLEDLKAERAEEEERVRRLAAEAKVTPLENSPSS